MVKKSYDLRAQSAGCAGSDTLDLNRCRRQINNRFERAIYVPTANKLSTDNNNEPSEQVTDHLDVTVPRRTTAQFTHCVCNNPREACVHIEIARKQLSVTGLDARSLQYFSGTNFRFFSEDRSS